MSRFNRTTKPIIKPKYKKPWHDPNYDGWQKDKKKIVLPPLTPEEKKRLDINNAKIMFKTFGYRPWMQGIIDQKGKEI